MNNPPVNLPPRDENVNRYSFVAGMGVDADGANGHDGSRRGAYGPANTDPLDYLANAGEEGNWWGVVTNKKTGKPIIQGIHDPAPGYYVSSTSYTHKDRLEGDPARYLDSAVEMYVVLPSHWRKEVREIVLGCHCVVLDLSTKKICNAVVGDFGPKNKLGEGSIALARYFGLDFNPKKGGTEQMRFKYTFYPGVAALGYRLIPM